MTLPTTLTRSSYYLSANLGLWCTSSKVQGCRSPGATMYVPSRARWRPWLSGRNGLPCSFGFSGVYANSRGSSDLSPEKEASLGPTVE